MRIYANSDEFVRTRIIKGLTQRDLAQLTGVSHGYISMVERAVKSVGPGVAKKVSGILDKRIEELFRIE